MSLAVVYNLIPFDVCPFYASQFDASQFNVRRITPCPRSFATVGGSVCYGFSPGWRAPPAPAPIPMIIPNTPRLKSTQTLRSNFITVEEVKQRLDAGEPQKIIDVRRLKLFDKTHLPGAVSIPLRDLETRIEEIPRDTPVVFY